MKMTRKPGPGKKLLDNLLKQDKAKVARVGFFPSATYPDGTSVAEVANKQEYGDPNNTLDGRKAPIPPRPFMRPTYAEESKNYREIVMDGTRAVAEGSATVDQVLEGVGLQMQGDIIKTISKITSPKLAKYTIAKRIERGNTSTKPLNDTGTMMAHVTYAVVDADGEGATE